MWPSIPSIESISRPRLAVAAVSFVAVASIGYYAYQTTSHLESQLSPGSGLHRSNAVRRHSRPRRNETAPSSSSSSEAGDENEPDRDVLQPLEDGETDVGDNHEGWVEPPPSQRAGANIVNLLFRVSEESARRNGCIHRGCQCNTCGMVPIRGVRYRCANCADFDLCETCESQGMHQKTHIFYKIRVPAPPFGPRHMQPVWYTGDPEAVRKNLPRGLIAKLSNQTGFERPELENFWEQWTFMANTHWRDDPDDLQLAMDRKTFERCLVPTGGSRHAAPNLIHDRMFGFYDSNKDGLIGFTEFLQGLAYRKRRDKLMKVFEGYDIDGDGYVDRKDFLRMFRAYYVLYKQMHKDILDGLEDQILASTEVQGLITSRQPLSSLFGREGRIPRGDPRLRLGGKTVHADGNVDVAQSHESVVDPNRADTATRTDILTSLFACAADSEASWRVGPRRPAELNEDLGRYYHERDHHERMINQHVADPDRPYILNLIEPPTSLNDLPNSLVHNLSFENDEDDMVESSLFVPANDEEDLPDLEDRAFEANAESSKNGTDKVQTESEARIAALKYSRRRLSEIDKRRRDLARAQVYDRWKRREFYLDEEEGGTAPDGWESDEQDATNGDGESLRGPSPSPGALHSPVSDSEHMAEPSTRTNGKESSWSMPERWKDLPISDPERDAGKEILYQVTQQAFNELLDIIFKPSEDVGVEAKDTKAVRVKFKAEIDAFDLGKEDGGSGSQTWDFVHGQSDEGESSLKAPQDKSLEELLSDSGYSVVDDQSESRNAVEIGDRDEQSPRDDFQQESSMTWSSISAPADYGDQDPTFPQFRPNSMSLGETYPTSSVQFSTTETQPEEEPAVDHTPHWKKLRQWKIISIAEEDAKERGGWGKLSFSEFEDIYRSQEFKGNRLDYLGSWIDFCIP